MRHLLALVLMALGAFQAWRDWGATIGQGEAYALSSVDVAWQGLWPWGYERFVPMMAEAEVPYLWDPVMATVLTWPLAVVCIGLGLFFFLIRRRREA
ncbi:MAG: hypothetical protein AAFR93_09740 [Pseudomonadota bacterium]